MADLEVRYGPRAKTTTLLIRGEADTLSASRRVRALLDADPDLEAAVDTAGMGAGLYGRLEDSGCRVRPLPRIRGKRAGAQPPRAHIEVHLTEEMLLAELARLRKQTGTE